MAEPVATDTFRFTAVIKSREDEQRRFYGTGYIHTSADGTGVTDHSGDTIHSPEAQQALEEAFYGFVKSYRSGDDGHEVFDAADMIEGVVVTTEKKQAGLFPKDMPEGIYVGFEARESDAGDVLWAKVRSGEYTALSIVGSGVRHG